MPPPVRLHYVVPLVIAYVVARSALADMNKPAVTVSYEVSSARPAPHVVPLEHHATPTPSAHIDPVNESDTGYRDPLFGPHDPNRHYHHGKEKQYFQVGVVDFERVRTPFVIGSWILAASLAKIGFHMFPKLSHMFPESCLLIVIGIIVGVILYFGGLGDVEAAHHLDPDTFFLFMLPPIILDAGYFMPNR
ncbi:sodium/hydrogen exchanger 1-like [Pollicipes pollicipes]|uniref:sodium/hydrogen exchanger 1-like n=1 Tax=Pollicipes pollicipes TaxID=41117 RepID=UPI001885446F|nr:sodium/hydrogen exchanger 1-like [Pollicipes pollicipes]